MTCNILVRLLFSFVVFSFACYGVVVFPMRVGLYCLVVYLWYVFTAVRFVTYLFSPCLPLTALRLFWLVSSVARHITYLFVGGRWRCCCLCVVCFGARTGP